MDSTFHEINRNFISLSDDEIQRNNQVLSTVLTPLIYTMRQKDPLFNAMYRRIFYGGSYYDGLKVGSPEEFDLDLLLDIPRYAESNLIESRFPGFVQLAVNNLNGWMRQPEAIPAYRHFGKLLDHDRFVNTDKVLAWMESLLQKSCNALPNMVNDNTSSVTFSKSGPALTLHIYGPGTKMDVDLVPCFVFRDEKWPRGFRRNPVPSKPEFFVVPKKPRGTRASSHDWRLSFQEQERALINNKDRLKPVLKLLKQVRDRHNDAWMASYYLKTIFLHACEEYDESFWKNKSVNEVFLTMLKRYKQCLDQGNIPYFWQNDCNLIHQDVKAITLKNTSRRLEKMIRQIEKELHNPKKNAKLMLPPREFQRFFSNKHAARDISYTYKRSDNGKDDIPVTLFALGIICIYYDKPRIGFCILLADALYISTYVMENYLTIWISLKYYITFLYVISVALHLKLDFLPILYLLVAAVELIITCLLSFDKISTEPITVALITFWMFSYVSCFEPHFQYDIFVVNLILDNLKLNIRFSTVLNHLLLSPLFTTFLLTSVIDFIFIGDFTFDLHLIVLIGLVFYLFQLVVNFKFLLAGGTLWFLSHVVNIILTFDNIFTVSVMCGAAACDEDPSKVLENSVNVMAIAMVLGVTKGVANLLSKIGLSKYMIMSMLVGSVVSFSMEVL